MPSNEMVGYLSQWQWIRKLIGGRWIRRIECHYWVTWDSVPAKVKALMKWPPKPYEYEEWP